MNHGGAVRLQFYNSGRYTDLFLAGGSNFIQRIEEVLAFIF
jgi:hypothetical protein